MICLENLSRDLDTNTLHGVLSEVGYTLPFPRMVQVKSAFSGTIAMYVVDAKEELLFPNAETKTYIAAEDSKVQRLILKTS